MRKKYDILVAGAGPAGICAAVEAARSGASVALLERYGVVGGNLTVGLVGPVMGKVCKGTMADEILGVISPDRKCQDFEDAKYQLEELLDKSGVDVYLQTTVIGCQVENGEIQYIEAFGKAGRSFFEAQTFIDATGDGDLAVCAGCEWQMGRSADALVQPVSLMFTICGVEEHQTLVCKHEEDYTILSNGKEYLSMCHEASKSGELPSNVNIVRLYNTRRPDERIVNATQANRIDPLDPQALFQSDLMLRRQIRMIVAFLRRNVPGFENVTVKSSPATLGVRESRRIMGEYVLTAEDLICGREFEDAVVHGASFSIDIHNPDGPGQSINETGQPQRTRPYDIPYRALLPKGIKNLLVSGRCISGTHEAMASYRVMNIAMAIGQASGAAAYCAVKNKCTPGQVDPQIIRGHLRGRGVQL